MEREISSSLKSSLAELASKGQVQTLLGCLMELGDVTRGEKLLPFRCDRGFSGLACWIETHALPQRDMLPKGRFFGKHGKTVCAHWFRSRQHVSERILVQGF